tara:strand:+ start:185 stop:604 length:420 start_codon:yes stop_codon:yes gene_type:complete
MKETNATEIIPNLWLGDYFSSNDYNFIKQNNIKTIVNVTPNYPNVFNNIEYLRLPIRDRLIYSKYLKNNIKKCINFINEARLKSYGVLVHCKRGHRRSATIVAYYLSYLNNISFNSAKKWIKYRRPRCFPDGSVLSNNV